VVAIAEIAGVRAQRLKFLIQFVPFTLQVSYEIPGFFFVSETLFAGAGSEPEGFLLGSEFLLSASFLDFFEIPTCIAVNQCELEL
jgi:hypothetical protein